MSDWARGDDPVYNGYREKWQQEHEEAEKTYGHDEYILSLVADIDDARLRELAEAEREELIYILPDCKTCANKDDNRTCALCVGKAIDYQSSFYEPLAATEPKGDATCKKD